MFTSEYRTQTKILIENAWTFNTWKMTNNTRQLFISKQFHKFEHVVKKNFG